ILLLIPTGPVDPRITQKPKHLVAVAGNERTLKCEQHLGHNAMYWYKLILGQEIEFLVSFYNGKPMDKSKLFKEDRFSVERQDDSYFTLKIQPTMLEDSAVYFCASSLATALQKHLLPVHKPSCVCLSPCFPRRRKSVYFF
ncbi:T cell receptor beta variable 2, partial [Lemmus lemmus]